MRALLLAAVVACGSSHGVPGGDAPGDSQGGSDAPQMDAPPVRGNVTVHLVDKTGAPVAGDTVAFVDTDTTATVMTTDASGAAAASVYPGASVTAEHVLVFMPPPNIILLATVDDVVPGDTVTLNVDAFLDGEAPLDTTSAGTFTVSFPSYTGANHYVIYTPCGATNTTKTSNNAIAFAAGCVAATMDVAVLAESNTNAVLASIDQSGVAFTSGGSVTIAGTWAAPATISATYTNAGSTVQNVQLARMTPDLRGSIAPPPPTILAADVTGASTMLQLTAPTSASAVMQTLARPCKSGDTTCTQMTSAWQTITQVVDGTQTAYSLDVGAQLLPWLGYPTWSKVTPTMMTIAVTGSGAIDLFEADLQFVRNNSNGNVYIWRVFAPAAGNVSFPVLPSSVPYDPTPQSTDTMSVTHSFACESDAIAGYRAAVANMFTALDTCLAPTATNKQRTAGTLNRLSQSN